MHSSEDTGEVEEEEEEEGSRVSSLLHIWSVSESWARTSLRVQKVLHVWSAWPEAPVCAAPLPTAGEVSRGLGTSPLKPRL